MTIRQWRRPGSLMALVVVIFFPMNAVAKLCATDPVPAATLLFPFVTATFDASSTPTEPKIDRSRPRTLFSITNVSSTAHIVHNVLYNDMGFGLLDWDVLLTGYDVVSFDIADVFEGYLRATGPATNPATGRPYSPTGTVPTAQGPVPSYFAGIPNLPVPQGTGQQINSTSSIFGLCTNPSYTVPFTIDPGNQAGRMPAFNRNFIFNGLRKSQVIAENGWWGRFAPYFIPPDWLLNHVTNDPVWCYVTSDVVDACGLSWPAEGLPYFSQYARPRTESYYANDSSSGYIVPMGNVLLGEALIVDGGGSAASASSVVHVEMDNQDIPNDPAYGKGVRNGASFYRYAPPVCGPSGSGSPDSLDLCTDLSSGSGIGSDYTTGAPYFFGASNQLPSGDFREPLPSAFAFRWYEGSSFPGRTKIRVWKEFPDLYPAYGLTYVYSSLQYTYYAWDEEEHVLVLTPGVDYPPEFNQLPLKTQEISVSEFWLPHTYMTFGWVVLAFVGSTPPLLPVPGGYRAPFPNAFGTQAWVEVVHSGSGTEAAAAPAWVLGNFLCDGNAVASSAADGTNRTDQGDVHY